MRYAGIDIGSRTIEYVIIDDNSNILHTTEEETGCYPLKKIRPMLAAKPYDTLMATGYGRGLCEVEFNCLTATEIKTHAIGAHTLFPKSSAVLDIGGQDSKVISLLPDGRVKKFEMNDRCAAGSGKFLEIMAQTLGYSLEEFGDAALNAKRGEQISSMCAVFAESEVTSLIAKGCNRDEIARGLHDAVINRSISMLRRVSPAGNIVFTGGVAHNRGLVTLLKEKLQREVLVPKQPFPRYIGAYGAALLAQKEKRSSNSNKL